MQEPTKNDTYNKSGFNAFVFSMLFSLGFMAYVAFFSGGVDLREIPQEEMATGTDQTLAGGEAPKAFDVASVQEPWVSSDEMVEYGHKVYQTNCAVCHGPEGKGDGAAGAGLNPPPRNFVEGKWTQGGTSIALFKTLETGIPGTSMASFAHLKVADRWALVHWIRSITNNKPEDDAQKLAEFGKSAK